MLSLDISRESFQRSKNYSGLRQQHGRVINESELNEGSDIAAEELRRAIQDVICNSGTPDDGFRVSFAGPGIPAGYDFLLDRGSYYIGGRRYDCFGSTFLTQPDWLQQAADMVPAPGLPAAERHDFVYLEGWQQAVSATEDAELFERALAGADGAGRLRRMARVHVVTDSEDSCLGAMEALFPDAMIDPDTMALDSGAGLTIAFDPAFVEENLCAPSVQTGFLGAENETFRVQLTSGNRFIYGRDNASHLYRVTLAANPGNAAQTLVTFLTEPRDVHSQPLALQAVEILRWTTRLPNGEYLAEPMGRLANILTDYDPEFSTLTLDLDVNTIDVDWDGAALEDQFFYLRVWTGGAGVTPPDHAIVDENPITMAGTGLTAAFALAPDGSFGMAGDHWVVAARPNAPDVVTPWQLLEDAADTPPPAPPHGPMRHVAPLAIIAWVTDPAGNLVPSVHDCRERFRKLCTVPTCCEITVGDGEHSHGDVSTINEAVARLPLSGGKICLLRGTFVESVTLQNRENIIFCGCGDETVWEGANGPALTMSNCHDITLQHFTMQADDFDVVLAGSRSGPTDIAAVCSGLTFHELTLYGRDQTALWLNDCNRTKITHCHVEMRSLSVPRTVQMGGTDPAIFMLGDDVLIERNWIGVTQDPLPPGESRPMAGIQLGGLSEGVVIRHNHIDGGKGNGITLGHLEWVPVNDPGGPGLWTLNGGWFINAAGCLVPGFTLTPPDGADPGVVPESGGELRNLRIEDNLIRDMGLNGIAVCHFFDLASFDTMVAVSNLRIERNEIRDCLTSDLETPPPEISYFRGYGGFALASCDLLYLRDNRIQDNGRGTSAPVCGVFVLFGAGIEIDDNHIFANGAATDAIGRTGGVNVGWCVTHAQAEPDRNLRATPIRRAALAMSGNVIDSPSGQAIKAVALGPVQITNNQLVGTSRRLEPVFRLIGALIAVLPPFTSIATGITALAVTDGITRDDFSGGGMLLAELIIAAMGGDAVNVFNAGWLEEFASLLGTSGAAPGAAADNILFPPVGGETMVNDNQVTLLPNPAGATNPTSAVMVASMDDVSLNANQIEADDGVGFILANAFTPAATVRMIANRMQESFATALFSGLSHSVFLNTQSLNQGTHCFAATALLGNGPFVIQRNHNLSLLEGFVASATDGQGYCGILQERLSGLFEGSDLTNGGSSIFDVEFPENGGEDTLDPGGNDTIVGNGDGNGGGNDTLDPGGNDTIIGDGNGTPQPEGDMGVVPNLMCDKQPEATQKLTAAGLSADVTFVHVSGASEPRVIGQTPTAGTQLSPGDTVGVLVGLNNPAFPTNDSMKIRYFRCVNAEDDSREDDKPIFGKDRVDYRLGGYTMSNKASPARTR